MSDWPSAGKLERHSNVLAEYLVTIHTNFNAAIAAWHKVHTELKFTSQVKRMWNY